MGLASFWLIRARAGSYLYYKFVKKSTSVLSRRNAVLGLPDYATHYVFCDRYRVA